MLDAPGGPASKVTSRIRQDNASGSPGNGPTGLQYTELKRETNASSDLQQQHGQIWRQSAHCSGGPAQSPSDATTANYSPLGLQDGLDWLLDLAQEPANDAAAVAVSPGDVCSGLLQHSDFTIPYAYPDQGYPHSGYPDLAASHTSGGISPEDICKGYLFQAEPLHSAWDMHAVGGPVDNVGAVFRYSSSTCSLRDWVSTVTV
jgi:hypothetical protein